MSSCEAISAAPSAPAAAAAATAAHRSSIGARSGNIGAQGKSQEKHHDERKPDAVKEETRERPPTQEAPATRRRLAPPHVRRRIGAAQQQQPRQQQQQPHVESQQPPPRAPVEDPSRLRGFRRLRASSRPECESWIMQRVSTPWITYTLHRRTRRQPRRQFGHHDFSGRPRATRIPCGKISTTSPASKSTQTTPTRRRGGDNNATPAANLRHISSGTRTTTTRPFPRTSFARTFSTL